MKKILAAILLSFTFTILGWVLKTYLDNETFESSYTFNNEKTTRPLDKYGIESLSSTTISQGEFDINDLIEESANFNSYKFRFSFDPTLAGETQKTTTGQLNIPSNSEPATYPVVVMLRGYVDQKLYKTGDGTRNAAAYFANNGFITIAPDFLGYADSDKEAKNIFESRFQTYTTVLSLIKSLNKPSFSNTVQKRWNKEDVYIWGHSNGGQVALTILEVLGESIPTTLWAPVSKAFPYSILYYTNESEDGGKLIRRELAKFEDVYDTDKYSMPEYFGWIKAPIQIQQGTADDAVPKSWSDSLIKQLKSKGVDVKYFIYSGADHNLRPNWNEAVKRDLEFFNVFSSK